MSEELRNPLESIPMQNENRIVILEDMFRLPRLRTRNSTYRFPFTPPAPLQFAAEMVRELDRETQGRKRLCEWLIETASVFWDGSRALAAHALTVIAMGKDPHPFDKKYLAPMVARAKDDPALRVRAAAGALALCWHPEERRAMPLEKLISSDRRRKDVEVRELKGAAARDAEAISRGANLYTSLNDLAACNFPAVAQLASDIRDGILIPGEDDKEFMRRLRASMADCDIEKGQGSSDSERCFTIDEMRTRFSIREGTRVGEEAALKCWLELIQEGKFIDEYVWWPFSSWAKVFGVSKSTVSRDWKRFREQLIRLRQTHHKPGSSIRPREFDKRSERAV